MIVTVLSVHEAESQNGKQYWRVETSAGKMSCWESSVAEGLKLMINKNIDADVAVKGSFRTIKGFFPTDEKAVHTQVGSASNHDRGLISPHTQPAASTRENSIESQCAHKIAAELVACGAFVLSGETVEEKIVSFGKIAKNVLVSIRTGAH